MSDKEKQNKKTERVELKPRAGYLLSSMRDIGYSFETAVADLVDNSISAAAKSIWIDAEWCGGTIKVYEDGAETSFPQPNVIEAKIDADRKDFVIEVKDFDRNFDLDIDDHYRDPSKWNLPEVTNG